jgi:Ala-tRNA(Pro) deacylase
MTVATTLDKYLAEKEIDYDVVLHRRCYSASRTAQASHVSGDRIAKAVVLKGDGRYLLAVLPATHHLELGELLDSFNLSAEMATEEEVGHLFRDCELGAIPPIGGAYGLDVFVDESIPETGDIYFEGGDHASLIHVTAEQFRKLTAGAKRGRFSRHDA